MVYDPKKAHDYYMRTRDLKGRRDAMGRPGDSTSKTPKSDMSTPKPPKTPAKDSKKKPDAKALQAKVGRLQGKVETLEGALTKAQAALSKKRTKEAEEARKNSDGKTTAKERQSAKEYRDKNKTELAKKEADRRESSKDSGGGSKSSSSKSSSSDESTMGVEQLQNRISKIKSALGDARKQLAEAKSQLGSIAHSAFMSDLPLETLLLDSRISRKESVKMTADFGGYATRSNIQCSDGRTILRDAFKDNDGMTVPLVWQHGHGDPDNVLGHVKLENREDGVYAHAYFNGSPRGQHAKEMVRHGDVRFLSIFANNLQENVRDKIRNLKDVVKGNIREVSLVLAGANPGAYIDNVAAVHSDGEIDVDISEAYITSGLEIDSAMAHAEADTKEADSKTEDDERSLEDILKTYNDEQRYALDYLVTQALSVGSEDVKHSDTDGVDDAGADNEGDSDSSDDDSDASSDESEGTDDANSDDESDSSEGSEEAADSDESEGAEDADSSTDSEAGDDSVQHDNTNQEDDSMTHNVFDQSGTTSAASHEQQHLEHSEVKDIIKATLKHGSLKDALEDYALAHGITNIDYLFPDAKLLSNSPNFISRRMEWVEKVLNGVRKQPMARIRTVHADITPEDARARGYVKGNLKNEEFFELIKRETTPQTVYKKQALHRDDVLDITDLDVVAWMKAEMKLMLDEELAGAILIGDGRSNGHDDKIKEDKIRPIASDAELYTTTVYVNLLDANSSVEELVDDVISNRQYYKGTGMPTFYTSEEIIGKFLTVKNGFGQRVYKNLAEVAEALRVSEIVSVDVFSRVPDIAGIMVNLADYSIGTDRGGQATMFDDFDLNYNKLLYLLETRCSGALTLPKSAIVFRMKAATDVELAQPTAPARAGNVITVPTVPNVTYKDGAGTTLTTASPVTLTTGQTLKVTATAAAGKYFPDNANDEWTYTYKA